MNAPAAQPAPDQELPPEAPPAELTDEEIFEQAFEERFGPDAGDPPPAGEPSPDADPTPAPADAAGDPPPADPGDPPVGDPPPEPQAGSEKEPEAPAWYNDLSDEAKAAFDKTASDLASVQDQYTALHGRLAPVQQENARLREQLDTRPAAPAPPASTPQSSDPNQPTSQLNLAEVPEFVEFKEAFPEEAKAIEAIFSRQTQHLTHLQGQLGEVSDGLRQVQTASSKSEREAALEKLSGAHPDWMTVRHSEDFERWRGTQPPSVARMADSPNADECIYILDRYKQDVYLQRQLDKRDDPEPPAPPAEPPETSAARATRERRQQLRAVPGVDPQAGDVGLPQGDPEAMLSDEEIWEREVERRLRAQRDSRR